MDSVEKRALQWLFSEETGLSSKNICGYMLSITVRQSVPWDIGDLGRCIRLLEKIPEWKQRMQQLGNAYPRWQPYADSWDELTRTYYQDRKRCADLLDVLSQQRAA